MGRESAGSVFITIDGDYSPLIAKYAQTETASRAAGQNIAQGLGVGLKAGSQQLAIFNALLAQSQTEEGKAAIASRQLAASLSGVAVAASEAAPEIAAVAVSTEAVGAAASHSVPQIAAASGALRVLEGQMSIRAAERFAVSILGLGPILQMAFPLVGAIALYEMFSRMVTKSGELSEAEKKVQEETKKTDEEWSKLAADFERGEVERAALELGRLSSIKLGAFYEESTAQRDKAALKDLTEQIHTAWAAMKTDRATATLSSNPLVAGAQAFNPADTVNRLMANQDWKLQADKARTLGDQISILTEKVKVYDDVTSKVNADKVKQGAASEAGKLQLAQLANQERAFNAADSLDTKRDQIAEAHAHSQAQVQIDAMHDRQAAAVAEAAEEVRAAKQKEVDITSDLKEKTAERIAIIRSQGAAELLGKTPEEIPAIQATTTGKISEVKQKADKEILDAHAVVLAAEDKLNEAQATHAREMYEYVRKAGTEAWDVIGKSLNELRDKEAAEFQRFAIDVDKIQELQQKAGITTGESQAKATGDIAVLAIQKQKLTVEQQYAAQIVHTKQQEIAEAERLAGLDTKERAAKLSSAQAQLALAQSLADIESKRLISAAPGTTEAVAATEAEISAKAKVLTLQETINKLIAEGDNADIAAQTKIIGLKRNASLGGQIQSAVGKGPGSILDAKNQVIAHTTASAIDGISSALGRAVQGGQRLSQIFTQLGRSILGEVVSMIAKIGLQMVTTALLGKSVGSSIAVAEVMSAAAVGAANAAASTAAIPIVGPALAPGVAAATFAEIMAYAALASYDKGGYIEEDQIAKVHKGEFVLTADQVAGRSGMPSLPDRGGGTSSQMLTASQVSNSSSNAMSIGAIHLHGVQNVEQFARRLPSVLKSRAPVFSPATR